MLVGLSNFPDNVLNQRDYGMFMYSWYLGFKVEVNQSIEEKTMLTFIQTSLSVSFSLKQSLHAMDKSAYFQAV